MITIGIDWYYLNRKFHYSATDSRFFRFKNFLPATMSTLLIMFVAYTSIIMQFTTVLGLPFFGNEDSTLNNRPIVGILTQELSYSLNKNYPDNYVSYIAASYVKFVEGAGARVVPIWIGKNESYYEDILSKINGVVWPGGTTWFNQSAGYADAGYTIYKIAKRMNKNGDYFPILGICLGFELLTYVVAERSEHRINCDCSNQSLPLEFDPDYRNSRMFGNASDNIINTLKTENVTANFHQYCVTRTALKKAGIQKKFRILSFNHDINNIRFISSLEHVSFPFYGLQFHPEKNSYEWAIKKNIPHGELATKITQYFANFFVNEARKNNHTFENEAEEARKLIYNYPVTYTALKESSFVQCYLFTSSDTI